MTTTFDNPAVTESRQGRALPVLARLINLPDLAAATWRIDANGHLEAYLPDRQGDDRRPIIKACAAILHLELRTLPMGTEPGKPTCVEAVGKYRGVNLRIWTPHYTITAVTR